MVIFHSRLVAEQSLDIPQAFLDLMIYQWGRVRKSQITGNVPRSISTFGTVE